MYPNGPTGSAEVASGFGAQTKYQFPDGGRGPEVCERTCFASQNFRKSTKMPSVPSVSCLLTQSQLNSLQRDQWEDGKQSGQGAFWGHLSRIVWQAEEAILRSERVTVRRAEIQI